MTTNKNEVKTDIIVETVKNNIDNLNSKKLKSFLQSAMNTSTTLENFVPKITNELIVVIKQYQGNQKNKVVLKDQEKFDTFKALRQFAYDLVEYDRTIKNNINGAFEMIVERSIRASLMSVNKNGNMQVLDGELVAESKVVKPITKEENHDKRIKAKFINKTNKSETLIPVNSSAIDNMWRRFNGTASSGGSKGNKSNIKTSANIFYADLHKVIELAKNKKYEDFYSLMSEDALSTILDIKVMLNNDLIRNTYKHCESNLEVNGSIKKAS
tara:strand:+ start:251 stop:1060 length:810 start_codon:yes stop_codon:yes gene_type:complete